MNDALFSKKKFFSSKIQNHKRPFIDANLQLQLPHVESLIEDSSNSYGDAYPHESLDLASPPALAIDAKEIEKAMKKAVESYENWKQMRQRLLAAAKTYFSQLDKNQITKR